MLLVLRSGSRHGVAAEHALDRQRFGGVVHLRAGAVGVDVADVVGRQPGVLSGIAHAATAPRPSGCAVGDAIRVAGRAVAGQLGEIVAPRALRMLERSSTSIAAPSPMTKPSRSRVERPAGARRLVVARRQGASAG